MKRLMLPLAVVLALASLGVVHPRIASASTGTLNLLTLPSLAPTGIHTDVPTGGQILAVDVYCTDGTTTCDLNTSPNMAPPFGEATVDVLFYGDPTRAYPFALSGNTPDVLLAECVQGYVDPVGDVHEQLLAADAQPSVGTIGGTITGKAVLLPSDTPSSTAAYAGMNVAGTGVSKLGGVTLHNTIDYVKGNQYTNNQTHKVIGGSGFEIRLTGTIVDVNETASTETTYPGSLSCSTGHGPAVDSAGVNEIL